MDASIRTVITASVAVVFRTAEPSIFDEFVVITILATQGDMKVAKLAEAKDQNIQDLDPK